MFCIFQLEILRLKGDLFLILMSNFSTSSIIAKIKINKIKMVKY